MANRKVTKQSVRTTQTKKRREEERKEKETFRNRLRAGGGVLLLVVVIVLFVFQLRGATDGEGEANNNSNSSEVAGEALTGEGTLIGGDRPLAEMAPAAREDFYDSYPEMIIDTEKSYQAVIRTEKGDMLVNLFDDQSPLAVNSFVFLATQGFYDGTIFHRVIPDFMAQAGDPTGSGSGGPGYIFDDEVENGLVFDRPGLLAMAKPPAPDSNGSQFFITYVETPHLDGIHTIFGELIGGEDILNSITFVQPGNLANQEPVGDKINRIDIYEN
jgi:peptidylprolyl isomerase